MRIDWRRARKIQIKNGNELLYECEGQWSGNMLYFLAEFTYKNRCTMLILDENGEVCGREILSGLKGKFGPGAINHAIFKERKENAK